MSLNRISSRFIHIVTCDKINFSLKNVFVCHIFFIHSSVDDCMLTAYVSYDENAVMNMGVMYWFHILWVYKYTY
jgi:hypothetical protein